jgi:hypothetical protein
MKNNCIRKQRREHAFLRRFWAPAFCAAVTFTGGTTIGGSHSFAAGITVLETRLRGGVDDPNPAGGSLAPANVLPKGFSLQRVAEGIEPLENPSGKITLFGFLSNGTRTEPDENTYLVLDHNPGGPTPGFDYGRHFLFQGHENSSDLAYITRINLDVVNPFRRITLLTAVGSDGLTGFNSIDGSTWNPHTKTLLFTQESSTGEIPVKGGVIEINPAWETAGFPRRLDGILGAALTRVFIRTITVT